jgi:hypothetical protein
MSVKDGGFNPPRIKAICKNCGSNRWATVVGHHSKMEEDEDGYGFWEKTEYRILKCDGCDEVFFQTDSIFSEDFDHGDPHPVTGELQQQEYSHTIEHWPPIDKTRRERPNWLDKLGAVDENLHSLYSSVYAALDRGIDVLAAIGVRTVFDRASELLSVDPAKRFDEKLTDLMAAGKIGADEKAILSILTDAGSAAAHRGWRPSQEQLDTMMAIIEGFLYRTFLLGADAKALRKKIPKRPKRKKKLRSP